MKKSILKLVLFFGFGGIHLIGHAQLLSSYTNRLQFVLDSVCTANKIKSASVAVLVPEGGIWKSTFGESYPGVPMQTEMLLGIGSNTKTFSSALLLKLQEAGKVSLDDTIGQWIHNKPFVDGQITIKQCLNHTSGIFSYTSFPSLNDSILADPFRVWKFEDMLDFLNAPSFPKGTSWEYSNTNYIIAGIIIQSILGKDLATCYKENFFVPLGLNNTILYPQQTSGLEMAHPWTMNNPDNKLEDMLSWSGYSNAALFSMAGPAGGIMSTAEDNVKFWNQLMNGKIIDSASLNKMLTFINLGYSSGHLVGYGLGIFRYSSFWHGHTILCHGGTLPGFLNENAVDQKTGICISVLSNQDSIGNGALFSSIVQALHNVSFTTPATGVEESANRRATFTIYPNPTSDVLHIQGLGSESVTVSFYNLLGDEVKTTQASAENSKVSLTDLSKGFYFLRLRNEAGEVIGSRKIEVE